MSLARRARCCAFGCLDGLRATRATSRGALSTSRELARAATPGRARSPAADGARSSACAEFFKYGRARGEHKFHDGRESARPALDGLQDTVRATRARWDPCTQRARAPVPAASGVRSSPAALLLVQLFAARATSAPMLLGMARFGGRVALAQGVRSACTGRVRAAARLRAYEVNCWMLIYCMRLIQKYIVYVACMRVYEAHATCMSQYEGWFDTGFIYEAHRRPV